MHNDGRLVVGCPVYERGWVIGRWFDRLRGWPIDDFIFCYTPSTDKTFELLEWGADRVGADLSVLYHRDGKHGTDRDWGDEERLRTLATMRNRLLEQARKLGADYYLSLDSDILASNYTSSMYLFEDLRQYDAVAPVHPGVVEADTDHRMFGDPGGIGPVICDQEIVDQHAHAHAAVRGLYQPPAE